MAAEQSAALADFARACKAAVRSVSLYPATHPAIQGSLSRVAGAANRLVNGGDVTLIVHPEVLVINGRAPVRPDPSIGELATLLHDRLIGELRVEGGADLEDWHALLLLVARTPEELIADGGAARAWMAGGRQHFEIRDIDYGEVLREKGDGTAEWDRIIAYCLRDDAVLDERALSALVGMVDDPARLGDLLRRLDEGGEASGVLVAERTRRLLKLLRRMVDAAGAERGEAVAKSAAAAAGRLTPDMMMGLIEAARAGDSQDSELAADVITHMSDGTIASFVAESVVAEHGATARLAQAFEALVPESERKERLLDAAKEQARQSSTEDDAGFEALWHSAADMLTSYDDANYVSTQYARELSQAKAHAIDVDRVSNDPPERVQAWLDTVADRALKQLDLSLLTDLLRIEADPATWRELARVVAAEVERRTLLGELDDACTLAGTLATELGPDGRPDLRDAGEWALGALASGPLVGHITAQLRKADDRDLEPLNRLAQTIGAPVIRPLAEALAVEQNNRAIRRLKELLIGFGAAGRQSVEQLKHSTNPAVRRTAIDLLRVFGGSEALAELTSMLDDQDPQVQRDAIRAIVQIGTSGAYAVLERHLVAEGARRETIVRQLIELHDDKAIPLLCYVLDHTAARGKLVQLHVDVIEALGGLRAHADSTRALKSVLYRGEWWAPLRTTVLRQAAATALRRIGAPDAVAVLDEAARTGNRGVRTVAREQAALATRRAPRAADGQKERT